MAEICGTVYQEKGVDGVDRSERILDKNWTTLAQGKSVQDMSECLLCVWEVDREIKVILSWNTSEFHPSQRGNMSEFLWHSGKTLEKSNIRNNDYVWPESHSKAWDKDVNRLS